MKLEVLKYLKDVQNSIDEIIEFTEGLCSFKDFTSDKRTLFATEKKLVVNGEAIQGLLHKNPEIEITNARRIVRFRNRMAHKYDQVDFVLVWSIAINHLIPLKDEVKILISKYSTE